MTVAALELRDVRKRYGDADIIRGVDLAVASGERCVLIGPNGAGKSSLFNLISGRDAPDSGAILLHGKFIAGMRPYRLSRMGLARSFQLSNLFPHLTVADNLRCAVVAQRRDRYAFWRGLNGMAEVTQQVQGILQQLGLQARAGVAAGLLTYAEQRALELGMALAGNAQVLLLDEPTAGMNSAEAARMVDSIHAVSAGRSLLMIEHDMGVVHALADRVAVLAEGRVVACDTPARIARDAAARRHYLDGAGDGAPEPISNRP